MREKGISRKRASELFDSTVIKIVELNLPLEKTRQGKARQLASLITGGKTKNRKKRAFEKAEQRSLSR